MFRAWVVWRQCRLERARLCSRAWGLLPLLYDEALSGRLSGVPRQLRFWGLFCVQIYVLDGHIPVRFEDFKSPLFLALVGFLVGKELLQECRSIKVVVRDFGVLENDRCPIVPAAVFGRMVTRRGRENLQDA